MKFRNNKNKLKIFLVIAIAITLITGLSTTYAFFIYRNTGSNVSLEAGEIKIEFANGNNYLNVENSYPVSDNTGKILPYYSDFTVNATTTDINIKYEIQIVPNSENTIDPQYIKVYLTDQEDNEITGVSFYNSLAEASYNENAKMVYSNYVTTTESKDFRLRVWIDEDYNNTTAQDFGFTIYLYAINDKANFLGDAITENLTLTTADSDGTRYVTGNKSSSSVTETSYNQNQDIRPNSLVSFSDEKNNVNEIDTTTDVNNYVWYSGKLWRIVSIDKDGNIKLVTQGNITSIAWSIESDSSGDSTIYNTNYSTSQVHDWLNNEFLETLENSDTLLVNTTWDYTTYATFPTGKLDVANVVVGESVGLLSVYDFMMTGGTTSSSTTNTFLNNGYHWWTMSPRINDSKIWNVGYDGVAGVVEPYYSRGIRPVIILKSNVMLAGGGTGEKENPYLIIGDKSIGKSSELLNNRISGEYISFNNVLYRIVGKELIDGQVLTKVTMADYDINNNTLKVSQKFGASTDEATFSPLTGIGLYLDEWYNADETNANYTSTYIMEDYKSMIATSTEDSVVWYVGSDDGVGYNYTLSKAGSPIKATIGLGAYGEMFSSQFGDSLELSNHIWLMTKYSGSENWFILSYGNGNYGEPTNGYGIRPSFYLKSDVMIGDVDGDGNVGTGMPYDPYEIKQ